MSTGITDKAKKPESDEGGGIELQEGMIILYHGSDGQGIPDGYAICDGSNNTPNLLDRFIKCTSDSFSSPGSTGGTTSESSGSHSHSWTVPSTVTNSDEGSSFWGPNVPSSESGNTYFTSTGSISVDNIPPYKELQMIKVVDGPRSVPENAVLMHNTAPNDIVNDFKFLRLCSAGEDNDAVDMEDYFPKQIESSTDNPGSTGGSSGFSTSHSGNMSVSTVSEIDDFDTSEPRAARTPILESEDAGISGNLPPYYGLPFVQVTGSSIENEVKEKELQGLIVMWDNQGLDAPEGWVMCDGDGDTPDLRDRFIQGVGTGSSVGFQEKDGVSSFSGSHSHSTNAWWGANSGTDIVDEGSSDSANLSFSELRPPYYELAFIMRTVN